MSATFRFHSYAVLVLLLIVACAVVFHLGRGSLKAGTNLERALERESEAQGRLDAGQERVGEAVDGVENGIERTGRIEELVEEGLGILDRLRGNGGD